MGADGGNEPHHPDDDHHQTEYDEQDRYVKGAVRDNVEIKVVCSLYKTERQCEKVSIYVCRTDVCTYGTPMSGHTY